MIVFNVNGLLKPSRAKSIVCITQSSAACRRTTKAKQAPKLGTASPLER